jgi:hypothetical protein
MSPVKSFPALFLISATLGSLKNAFSAMIVIAQKGIYISVVIKVTSLEIYINEKLPYSCMVQAFDIDVSGEDLLNKNYTICIANRDSLIKGFKFSEELVNIISSKYGQGAYRYTKSKRGKSSLKVRLYCVVIYYLFKSLKIEGDVSLSICKDFDGREEDIKGNLRVFLEKKLNLSIKDKYYFVKLNPESNAHKYAYLMRNDNKNKMNTYVNIPLEDLEKWLIK